jgi:hypothetical protein
VQLGPRIEYLTESVNVMDNSAEQAKEIRDKMN